MTNEEFIKTLRLLRNTSARSHLTDVIHQLERYSLGTEIIGYHNEPLTKVKITVVGIQNEKLQVTIE